jgi:acyl-CoA reductase-like NAD-dependent aldehyde dehydrogenase
MGRPQGIRTLFQCMAPLLARRLPFLTVPSAQCTDGDVDVYAPYDNKHIASIPSTDAAGIETALTTAYSVFQDRSKWLSTSRRVEILKKLCTLMEERVEELTIEAAQEGGKPYVDSKVEVLRAIDGINVCIETLRTQAGTEVPMNLNASSAGRLAITRHEPVGVVVAVSAFNHPLNLIVHQAIPAVATGCPVIVKPAEDTPVSCWNLVKLLREAGLPAEYCQAVVTKDVVNAEKLVCDPRVAFFTFIGSAKVGWMLRSKLAPGTKVALEHGGAAPVIVAPDADIDMAIGSLSKGGFYHAGQVCVSVQRVFAPKSMAREVAARFAEVARIQKIGDPTEPETEVGPLIRHREVDRVHQWVTEAVQGGAELLVGGNKVSDSCYECTVLYDPPKDAKVSLMEIFGPVICVYPYDHIDEALERANNVPFQFQAAVWTKDIDTALRCYSRLSALTVMVNDHTAFRVDWMPFGGGKESGLSVGGLPHTMHDMQIQKMLVLKSPELGH